MRMIDEAETGIDEQWSSSLGSLPGVAYHLEIDGVDARALEQPLEMEAHQRHERARCARLDRPAVGPVHQRRQVTLSVPPDLLTDDPS